MRRNEEYLPARRGQNTDLSPWSQGSLFSPSSFFSASPWQMMRRMHGDMDRIFGQFLGGQGEWEGGQSPFALQSGMQQWTPHMDISQTDREWTIEIDLPGVKQENIDVRVDDRHLIIRAEMRQEEEAPQGGGRETPGQQTPGQQAQGQQSRGQQAQGQQAQQRQYARRERRYGFCERVLRLPENVDEENIQLEFQSGVLTVHLPKTEQIRERGRRIPIQSGAAQGQGAPSAAPTRASQSPAGAQPGQTAQTNGARAMAGTKGGEAGSEEKRRKRQP